MRRIFSTIALVILIATNAFAQSIKQVIPVPQQGGKEAGLIVSFDSYGSLPAAIGTKSKYSLFGFDPKNMGGSNEDLSADIRVASVTCITLGGYCEIRSNVLVGKLDTSKTYILGIDDFSKPGEREVFTFKVGDRASIKGPLDPSSARDSIRIVAPLAIKPTTSGSPSSIVIERETLTIGHGSFYVEPKATPIPVKSAERDPSQQNVINVKLGVKLDEAQVHSLKATGGILTDAFPLPTKPITARGNIELGGLPSDPDAPKLSTIFSSSAGVKQKAFFDFKLDYKPKNEPVDLQSGATWKPSVALDVGLRSTKSSNSIVLSFVRSNTYATCRMNLFMTQSEKEALEKTERELREYERQHNIPATTPEVICGQDKVVIPDPKLPDGAVITNTYANWSHTPWTRRSHIAFEWGPKLEADRDFNKINILGTARLDFVFHRWLGTINYKRRLILQDDEFADDRKAAAGKLKGPFFGFMLVPYLSFDLGRRAYSETIEKKVTQQINGQPVTVNTSVSVPEFNIARATLGIKNSFEWYTFKIPTTLSFNEAVIFVGSTESVGFTNDQGAFLRRVRGFHPNFKTSLDFAIDPAGHYSFDITWDNGRTPPSFEYLNKLSSGLKIIY